MAIVCAAMLAGTGCTSGAARPRTAPPAGDAPTAARTARPPLIPWPAEVALDGPRLAITKETAILAPAGDTDLRRMAGELATLLAPALDARLPIREGPGGTSPVAGTIELALGAPHPVPEAYTLVITPTGIRVTGGSAAGVFYGIQTLRQLMPASVESRGARPHAIDVPVGRIADRPRYPWRGLHLDVARHFFGVRDVKRVIDLMALHKLNRLHLHLTDDQGWRIEIAKWPRLTSHGGSTAVGGGPGGFYTKADFAEIVAYARDRFVMVIPEIETPSHNNAALASYPELNCDGRTPTLYTGIEVGFSAFCVDRPIVYQFLDEVVAEVAAMTPGPYIHIGGDEVKKLSQAQYNAFIERMQGIVETHGKQVIGWDEIAHATLRPNTIVQYWRPDASITTKPGTKLILSPANRVYLDMKYHKTFVLGLDWAGLVDVHTPYDWNPDTLLPKVAPEDVLGVEAALWSETLVTMQDVELMMFPRLAAVAEVAWSPQAGRQWTEFRSRLGAQGPRWSLLGINGWWSPAIDWTR